LLGTNFSFLIKEKTLKKNVTNFTTVREKRDIGQRIVLLENRLDGVMVQFNATLAQNTSVRKEIDHLVIKNDDCTRTRCGMWIKHIYVSSGPLVIGKSVKIEFSKTVKFAKLLPSYSFMYPVKIFGKSIKKILKLK
jgi:hypothetical protein